MKISIFALLFLIFSLQVSAQTPTNLQRFESLTNDASKYIATNFFSGDRIPSVSLSLPGDYKVLYSAFLRNLTENGITVTPDNSTIITLKIAAVTYSSPFTKGFLGDYYTERTQVISGDMGTSETKFRFETVDTVKLAEVKDLENRGLPFTMSDIPKEPFWGSLTNVAIAAGATVLAVVLFFTVRSN
jgi:hypothetical protein